jgi:hypothetical protein
MTRLIGMEEPFPLYDDQPAQGGWPGGKRYGFRSEVVFVRDWTTEELQLARTWKIDLPIDGVFRIHELWWDQPYRHRVYVRPEMITCADIGPVLPSYEQYVVTGRRYGAWSPVFDLDAAVKHAERVAEIRTVLDQMGDA